jgi:hypothetical protein
VDRRDFLAQSSALLWAGGAALHAVAPRSGEPAPDDPPDDVPPAGAGAVAAGTPAWVDVRAYGASPSAPAAGNDAAFAAALAAVPVTGGVLYVPSGTYLLAAPVTLPSNVIVQGDGMNATVLRQTTATANGITLSGAGPRYVAVRDLKLVGPRSGTGIGVELTTTTTSAVASCDLSRLWVQNFGSHGVSTNTLITSTLTGIRVQGCGGDGFHLLSGTSVTLTSCYALSCTGSGYQLDSVTYSTLVNSACDNCGTGYRLTRSGNLGLVACGSERARGASYLVDGGTANTLLGCYSSGNAAVAFQVTGDAALVSLTGVRESQPVAGATASIQVDAGCSALVVSPSVVSPASYAPGTTNRWTPGALTVAAPGTATADVERSAATGAAAFGLATAGAGRWTLGLAPDATDDLHLRNEGRSRTAVVAEDHPDQPNLQLLGGAKSFGKGAGVLGITNATRRPTCDPVDGGILYVEHGALKYRGSRGTVTTIARA